jgi:hypothetical protein
MDAVQNCIDRLRELAEAGSAKPQDDAAAIVREFKATANEADRAMLKARLENLGIVEPNTLVPTPYLTQHSRWLAVIEGARSAA